MTMDIMKSFEMLMKRLPILLDGAMGTMLQSAGLSFAMGNAVDEAKQTARFVIGAAKDDGVARCLEQFFL